MSGFEVVGFVFNVLPLMIAGLQEVNGRTSKILFKYQHVIASFIRDLDMEHAQLRSTLEKMLSGMVNEIELAQLLEDQQHPIWKDTNLENRMKQRLGPEAYRVYIITMSRVATALVGLREAVGFNQGKKSKWHHGMRNRLKKCLEDTKHTAVLQEIRICNQALSKLTDDTLILEPLRLSRRAKADTNNWESIRELATSLHQALESGWLCDCSTPHLAHLRLEKRSNPADTETKFGVLFSSISAPRGCQETEIKIMTGSEVKEEVESVLETATSHTRSVSFGPDLMSASTINGPRTDSSILVDDWISNTRIEDLCRKLKQCKKSGCIGFLDDDHHKHYIQVIPSTMTGEDIVSLAEILDSNGQNAQHPHEVELGLREKYELAVVLAMSVLQLHATPWLHECWSNKDLYFARRRSESSPALCAYIQKSFNPPKVRAMSNPELTPVMSRPSVRNETIFALGVCLIELSLGRTLASFQEETDLGPDGKRTILTDWMIANRVLKERIVVSEGDRYSKTVHRCINCVFEPLDPTLESAVFREAFYNNAVLPLKDILIDFVK
ncbi:hypothetical protein BKA64DRAFT_89975 [Cadophora sp. MPI-SDFR-AT-0126]|nr:hypothetical protein BKA64DRAFT_89975 [Leotiomycetes sp. MPI-SDFR-AT-0126]